MRHAASSRRSRNRGNNGGNRRGNNRSQVFDSNGPEVRIRGTAFQICEKYGVLAKDAAASGDMILAESYLQHAEHYQRIISNWAEEDRAAGRHHEAYRNDMGQPDAAASDDEDLSLPSSILGSEAKAGKQDVRASGAAQKESVLESA